ELGEKCGIALGQLAVNLQTDIGPTADPLTVVQIGPRGFTVASMRFVITPARTQRPRPAPTAIGLVRDVMLLEKRVLRGAVDPIAHGPKLVRVRASKPMTERHIPVRGNTHQAKAGATRVRLADAFVQLIQGFLDVGEAMVPIRDSVVKKLIRKLTELRQH